MEYYILEKNARSGPFDIVTMIRKIRNQSLSRDTLVEIGTGEEEAAPAQPAGEIEKLAEIFEETARIFTAEARTHHYSLKKSFQSGLVFLQNHLTTMVYAGFVMLLTMACAMGLLTFLPGILACAATYYVFLMLLFIFAYIVLRMARGQSADLASSLSVVGNHSKQILIAVLVIGTLSNLGMLALAVPGLMLLTLYIFTPFLILDKQLDFWDAMEASRRMTSVRGIDFFSITFALVVVNFIGAIALLFPLVITLPVTMYALAELYDEHF